MAVEVIMPKQGLQMTEGTIISWMASEGDTVQEGDPLFEIETDKLTIEIGAPSTGVLLKILRQEGDVVPITERIAVIGEQGEDISELIAQDQPVPEPEQPAGTEHTEEPKAAETTGEQPVQVAASGSSRYASPRARWKAEELGIDVSSIQGTGPDALVIEQDVLQYAQQAPKATPLAKRLMQQNNTDMASVKGTGPRGKIYSRDLVSAEPFQPAAAQPEDTIGKLSGMRKTIAARMRESLDTAAQAVHRVDVDMYEAVRLRKQLKAADSAVSFNDIIVMAVAKSLRRHPNMNSAFTDDGIITYGSVHVGVAVALDEGLLVPVLRNADRMSLHDIHQETRRLGEAARSGTLLPDEMTGGTFSVSNLGMFGIDSFTAIINSPESGILAIGAIVEKPVVIDGEITVRPICQLSLTYDHRLVDGAPAALFLQEIKKMLSNPYLLL
jgi:pyruvate dehydrogenase E2 component (dihydrolipoamide acetyltransferase)